MSFMHEKKLKIIKQTVVVRDMILIIALLWDSVKLEKVILLLNIQSRINKPQPMSFQSYNIINCIAYNLESEKSLKKAAARVFNNNSVDKNVSANFDGTLQLVGTVP